MRTVLDAEPTLDGGVVPHWEDRPVAVFEHKGVVADRSITDLAFAGPRGLRPTHPPGWTSPDS